MNFDSHIGRLLTTAVRLVNATTPGADGGHAVATPTGPRLIAAVAAAIESSPTAADAEHLADVTRDVRLVFEATDRGDVDTAAHLVNALLERTGAQPRLDRFGDSSGDRWSLHFHGPDTSVALGWAAGLAAGLAVALGSDLAGRLGVCDAPGCDRVYVDTSRNGGRRFCTTRCQNRVKAAAHRSRKAAPGGTA